MPHRPRPLAAGALIAITVAGCGAGVSSRGRQGDAAAHHEPAAIGQASPALPAGWGRLRLRSGAMLPYPAGWRPLRGDPSSASAALLNPDGTIRAYLNATPAEGSETLAVWARFRVRHNAAEGDLGVRLITAQTSLRLAAGRASCVVDDYMTSRSRYRELACILAPVSGRQAAVLVAAAQPNVWTSERPALQFAINHFTR
jgi:hypothetical protein